MKSIIIQKLVENAQNHPNRNAIYVDNIFYTYQELYQRANSLSQVLLDKSKENTFCAILSDKNFFAYQSILGILFAGKAYVPLNPLFPIERNVQIMKEVTCEFICVDVKKEIAIQFLEKISPTTVILYRKELYEILTQLAPKHSYFYWDFAISQQRHSVSILEQSYAYLMFTSGSTGKPKGIAITHNNLSHYVSSICQLFQPTEDDRFSQLSEFTFDLSIHEMFVCWASAATLYVVPDSYMLGIKRFIQKNKITHWISVPSNIMLLKQLKQLEINAFPSIKQSLFCGEIFLNSQAQQWSQVAPHSKIFNLYGPTEATVAFTYFEWDAGRQNDESVPIGTPFPNQYTCVIDTQDQLVKRGEIGELCLAGEQVISAYWNNPAKSENALKQFAWDKENKTWYRTGDLVRWRQQGGYIYHGRIDDQWQVRGYRIEKLEVENELRKIANHNAIAVIPVESADGQVESLAAFVCEEIDAHALMKTARQILPSPLVPKRIISLKSLPQNANGKIDYLLLKKQYGAI